MEYGRPIGMPTCRPLGEGLWEVRSSLTGGRISQVLFCIADDQMFLLHAFVKKTQQTPTHELSIARQRQREVAE